MSDTSPCRGGRREKNICAVRALTNLLEDVCANPSSYEQDQALPLALKSQGSLAKHKDPGRFIDPMSLNNQKAIAELVLGSYQVLDSLRRAAREALEVQRQRKQARGSSNKAGLVQRIKDLEAEQAVLLEDLMILQRAFDLRCQQARQYASNADEATKIRCAKEQREVDASLSLRRRPAPQTNVIQLGRMRQ